MKNIFYSAIIIMLIATACKHAPKADEAITKDAQNVENKMLNGAVYTVDLQKSNIQWIGTKATGSHHGTLMLKEGLLNVSGNNITGGRFVVDINTLTAYDEDGSANTKLQGHLKSEDFFDVAKYSTASFEITEVKAGVYNAGDLVMKDATHTVTGNLKIKDITKNITFPAKINITGSGLTADADFNIIRTLWGINYHSDKSLGDKFINPEVNVKVHLEAGK